VIGKIAPDPNPREAGVPELAIQAGRPGMGVQIDLNSPVPSGQVEWTPAGGLSVLVIADESSAPPGSHGAAHPYLVAVTSASGAASAQSRKKSPPRPSITIIARVSLSVGHESIYTPASGALRAGPARKRPKQAAPRKRSST